MATKSISHEEYLRRRRNKKFRRIGIFLFITVLIIILASYVSHRPEIRISTVELNGGILVTQAEVESSALTNMLGSHFWLFPKNNSLWYPKDELAQFLQEKFERIDTINIHRKNFHTLVVQIKEKKPFGIWCDNSLNTETLSSAEQNVQPNGSEGVLSSAERTCHFLDQNGTIFAKAPHFSGDAYFKYYGLLNLSDDESPIGRQYIASTTDFYEISNLITEVRNLSIRPLYLVAKDSNEFSLVISGGGEIYFDMTQPLYTVSMNLEALLRTPAFAGIKGDLPVEYIDLRYGNKLFYKLRSD